MPIRHDVFTGRFVTEMDWDKTAGAILEAAGDLDDRGRFLLKEVGRTAVKDFKALAPEGKSRRLSRGIRAVLVGDTLDVEVSAIDPESGFDYAAVTRFGHEVEHIVPVNTKALKTKVPKPPGPFFKIVKGYHPAADWAEPGFAALEPAIDRALEEFGQRVMDDIGRRSG